jgi:26S proteasome regulatory subunit N6
MRATARALKERSLDLFKTALKDYQERTSHITHHTYNKANWIELQQDPLIRSHLSVLYDTLLEQNLIRVIEPYSSVQLTWIAQEVGQDVQIVEEKLSQMILDQVFYGVLNENEGTLEIHDQPIEDVGYHLLLPAGGIQS